MLDGASRGGIMSHVVVLTHRRAVLGTHVSMADDSLPILKHSEESDLLQRISQGETDRFADLISRYQRHVIRIVGRRVPADQVEEIVHDVFVRAYIGLAQYSQSFGFDHWLSGIAVRTCFDFWRAQKRTDVPVST